MSRIGKKPISLPAGVEVNVSRNTVIVRGPRGELRRQIPDGFSIDIKEKEITILPPANIKKNTSAFWGTIRQHIGNMIKGVSAGFEKKLEFEGIGYKAEVSGNSLVLSMGFTHPVKLEIPAGIKVDVAKNVITISGADKESVGRFAADIRKIRSPEPYKGTGIRYAGESIRRKAGKKLAGATAA